jgi:aminoglycoside phosphotransferase (APT) family kinase protein
VLRLARAELPFAERAIELEAIALAAAAEAGVPAPKLYERVTRDGRPGLVIERLDGRDLLTLLGDRPWSIVSVARRTGRLHAELHGSGGPASLPELADIVRLRLEVSDAVPAELRDDAYRSLAELPTGDRLCHGDFHPGNVIASADRERVIDWTNAARGDPVADVARTWVVLKFSPLPPGAGRAERLLAPLGRGTLRREYMRAYLRTAPLDLDRLARWRRVRAIERLAQEIQGEREPLLAWLARPAA